MSVELGRRGFLKIISYLLLGTIFNFQAEGRQLEAAAAAKASLLRRLQKEQERQDYLEKWAEVGRLVPDYAVISGLPAQAQAAANAQTGYRVAPMVYASSSIEGAALCLDPKALVMEEDFVHSFSTLPDSLPGLVRNGRIIDQNHQIAQIAESGGILPEADLVIMAIPSPDGEFHVEVNLANKQTVDDVEGKFPPLTELRLKLMLPKSPKKDEVIILDGGVGRALVEKEVGIVARLSQEIASGRLRISHQIAVSLFKKPLITLNNIYPWDSYLQEHTRQYATSLRGGANLNLPTIMLVHNDTASNPEFLNKLRSAVSTVTSSPSWPGIPDVDRGTVKNPVMKLY